MKQNEFKRELEKLGITLDDKQLNLLNSYCEYLLEYNKHTNLTAIKTKEEVYLKHFYDSLTLIKIEPYLEGKLLDVGTGAGFPGLVLAIVFPNLEVTLLDSNNKKMTFLKKCLEKLQLKNVKLVNERAENFTKKNRELFDYVTSRAVAKLNILLELNIPALKEQGKFLVMKGILEEELRESEQALKILSCKIINKIEFELPNNAGKRTLLNILKEKKTDLKYPRAYDKIKKKSL